MITPELLKKAITNVTSDPVRAIDLHYPRIMALSLLSTHDDSLALVAEELNVLMALPEHEPLVFSGPHTEWLEERAWRYDAPNSITGGQDFTAEEQSALEDQA